jgi:hypothetical protein
MGPVGAQTGKEPNQGELSAHIGSDERMTSEVARRLQGRGLAARAAVETNARARRLPVTAPVAAVAGHALAAVEDVDDRFLSAVRNFGWYRCCAPWPTGRREGAVAGGAVGGVRWAVERSGPWSDRLCLPVEGAAS